MSVRVRIEEDPAHPEGGHALIRIFGVVSEPADARFAILRDGWERGVLGPNGWQVGAALLAPTRVAQQGGELVLSVGPDVVDVVETGPVRFRLPGGALDVTLFWPDLTTSHAGSGGPVPLRQPPRTAPSLAPPIASPEDAPLATATAALPPTERAPLAAANARGGSAALLLLLVLLVVGSAGGAYWWFEASGPRTTAPDVMAAAEPARSAEMPPSRPIVPPAQSVAPMDDRRAGLPPAPAPVSPAAAAPDAAPPGLADLTVPQVIARAPGVAEIAGEAAARAGRGLHEDSLLLWEAAARLGHAPSLTALGRLYDPVGFQPGRPFRTPDPRQAARYYQQAVRAGDAGAEAARSALRDWLEQQRQRGDTLAPLTLQDFWP